MASNPHYLKGSSKNRGPAAVVNASEEFPVTPINLSVPLQVSTSKKLSDKYLELEKSKENKHSKKNRSAKEAPDGKKNKKKKKSKVAEGSK